MTFGATAVNFLNTAASPQRYTDLRQVGDQVAEMGQRVILNDQVPKLVKPPDMTRESIVLAHAAKLTTVESKNSSEITRDLHERLRGFEIIGQ